MVDDYFVRANGLVEYLSELRQQNKTQKQLFDEENDVFDNRIADILRTFNKKSLRMMASNNMTRRMDMIMEANELYDVCQQQCVLICKVGPLYRAIRNFIRGIESSVYVFDEFDSQYSYSTL